MDYTERYRALRDRGQSRDEALAQLRRAGASPIWCIRAIAEADRTGLAEAKRLFSESPSWADVVQANDDSLIKELEFEVDSIAATTPLSTQSMVIRYKASRSDIGHACWYSWRHSGRLNVLRLFIFGWVFLAAHLWLRETVAAPVWRLAGAGVVASLAVLLLAVYPLLRFKRDERVLTISPTGIVTTIGKQGGDVPWGKIARVALVGERIFILGTNGNAFAVPPDAFGSDAQRAEFLQRASQWWNEARVRPSSTRGTLRREDASAVGDPLTVADALRQQLEALGTTLSQHGEHHVAQLIQRALAGREPDLRTFLVSNELWGGPGSIADQAGIDQTGLSQSRESRRAIEAALIALGRAQMQQGLVNVRTEMWVETFSKWQREGI